MATEELARLELPAEPVSVGHARRTVASTIEGKVDDDDHLAGHRSH